MLESYSSESISGLIERVTFHSDETGFAVLRVKATGHRNLVTVVATLPSVSVGEWVEAKGRWTFNREHGQQFKSWKILTTQPNTAEGIEKYLGSGLVRGIGPTFAKRLVDAFGDQVFDVIDNHPDRLLDVEGIGPIRKQRLLSSWAEQKAVRKIIVFLHSHKVGTARAFRIYKTYKEDAIRVVTENPYRLAQDIWGVGFKTADQIASSLGIDRQSDIRARAGVEYVLNSLTEEGHCAYPREDLLKKTVEVLDIPANIIERAIDFEVADGRLVLGTDPTYLVYLSALYSSELLLAENLATLQSGFHPFPRIDIEKAIEWTQQRIGLKFAAAQKEAIRMAVRSKVVVITGGPGVGKTTLLNAILQIFRAKNLRPVLCAPTGRAAKRMSESTGLEAKTVHRLLEFDPKTAAFKRNHDRRLNGDVFVIAESSMLDLVLAHQTIRAIPDTACLILVGDVDQLPSVGPGSVLRDIIESKVVPVCRLTKIFRQAAESRIIVNSHRVNNGQMPEYPRDRVADPGESDFYFIKAQEPEDGERIIRKLITEYLPKKFGLDPRKEVQVLTPMQRGTLGTRNLNQVLQEAINPSGPSIERFGLTYRVGDKVMQIVNNYNKDVFNGDIGNIEQLNDSDRAAIINFDGQRVEYFYDEFDEITLSYAVTIHKSQGSEYPCVVIPMHTQHYTMLQRNLFYTGLTRGRKLVVIVGTVKAMAIAVKQMQSRKRITTLTERLIGGTGKL